MAVYAAVCVSAESLTGKSTKRVGVGDTNSMCTYKRHDTSYLLLVLLLCEVYLQQYLHCIRRTHEGVYTLTPYSRLLRCAGSTYTYNTTSAKIQILLMYARTACILQQ